MRFLHFFTKKTNYCYFVEYRRFFFAFLVVALSACSSKEPPTVLKQGSLPDGGSVCRIAVLPFVNQTNYSQAGDLFSKVFVSELVNEGNYQVAQEGDVRRFLQQMQLLPNRNPDVEQLRALADRFGAQVIISGTITEMSDRIGNAQKSSPVVAVVVRIVEGDSGRVLWSTYSRREGQQYRKVMHFGLVNSVTSLAKHVADEIVESWNNEGLKKCLEQ